MKRCHVCRRPRQLAIIERAAVMDDPESAMVFDLICEKCGAVIERRMRMAS